VAEGFRLFHKHAPTGTSEHEILQTVETRHVRVNPGTIVGRTASSHVVGCKLCNFPARLCVVDMRTESYECPDLIRWMVHPLCRLLAARAPCVGPIARGLAIVGPVEAHWHHDREPVGTGSNYTLPPGPTARRAESTVLCLLKKAPDREQFAACAAIHFVRSAAQEAKCILLVIPGADGCLRESRKPL